MTAPNRFPRPWRAIAAWLKGRYLAIVWRAFSTSPLMKAWQAGAASVVAAHQPFLTEMRQKVDDCERQLAALKASRTEEIERAYALGFESGRGGRRMLVELRGNPRAFSSN